MFINFENDFFLFSLTFFLIFLKTSKINIFFGAYSTSFQIFSSLRENKTRDGTTCFMEYCTTVAVSSSAALCAAATPHTCNSKKMSGSPISTMLQINTARFFLGLFPFSPTAFGTDHAGQRTYPGRHAPHIRPCPNLT